MYKQIKWHRCAKLVQRHFFGMTYCQAIEWIRNNYFDFIPLWNEKHLFEVLSGRFNDEKTN